MMYPSIFELTEQQLSNAQGKITYLGEQTKPIPSVVFSPPRHPVVMERFLKVQATSTPYVNDKTPYTKDFRVSPGELQRMLSSAQPLLTRYDVAKGPSFLSFTIAVQEGDRVIGQEIRIGYPSGKEFFRLMIKALQPENQAGIEVLSRQEANCYP